MIAQTPYQNMIYSQPQMTYTPQMYNPWTTRPQSQVQPMPVEQSQQSELERDFLRKKHRWHFSVRE